MGELTKKDIVYTQTLPNGAVLVVLGVPALCAEDDEEDFCAFEPEVAERLEQLIAAVAATHPAPGEVRQVRYSEDPEALRKRQGS